MMELTLLEIIGSIGGIGGLFAVILLFIYRRDRKSSEDRMRDDRRFMEDRLTKLLEADQESREDNTKALTELTTLLVRINGNAKRS